MKTFGRRKPEELSEEPSGSSALGYEVPTDDKPALPNDDDNKLPPCPYGKKCYR